MRKKYFCLKGSGPSIHAPRHVTGNRRIASTLLRQKASTFVPRPRDYGGQVGEQAAIAPGSTLIGFNTRISKCLGQRRVDCLQARQVRIHGRQFRRF